MMTDPTPATTEESAPRDVEELEERLSRPSQQAIQALDHLEGDLMLLGAGGKMGPTLARMARRASEAAGRPRRVFGVSRFSEAGLRERLSRCGVETIVCDLLDETAVAGLPDVPNVIYMSGMKFGASREPDQAWAMNCYAPAVVCRKFRGSRLVAFSSGNVYGLVPADSSGSRESDPLDPLGEYSVTVLGRERMFQYFSRTLQIPAALLRLNYASEMRYGVLVDIARQVLEAQPIDLAIPVVNVIWQGEANAMTLAALTQAALPLRIINLAGPEILRVREVAERFGQLLGKPVRFEGQEGPRAYLNDGRDGQRLLGPVRTTADQMIRWTAQWIRGGGASLSKPTHFEVTDGKF